MSDKKIFSKFQLQYMNYNPKYGSNWISNLNNINNKQDAKLYATGDYDMSSGRVYIALPANKILTFEDKKKYNIIE
jgi:hypothetical protein